MKLRIVLNVSGCIFETHEDTLRRYPSTLLGDHLLREHYFCGRTQQYYFNRDRGSFEAILFFYQSPGKLYRPSHISLQSFLEECQFFQLPERNVEILKELEGAKLLECLHRDEQHEDNNNNPTSTNCFSKWRMLLWNFFENPNSSVPAKILLSLHMFMVAFCITMYCLETVPYFGHTVDNTGTILLDDHWTVLEILFSSWFLLDFIIRLILCPHKLVFLKSPMVIIDMLSLPPYSLIATSISASEHFGRFLKALRFLRIIRLLHMSKLSRRIRIIFFIVEDSLKDLQYFVISLAVITATGGGMIYSLESMSEDSDFVSVPQSFWWSLQAFLTIGYGDIVPKTSLGKLFSSFYMVFGLTTIMMPVLSIILKLVKINTERKQEQMRTEKIKMKKKKKKKNHEEL